MNPLQIITATHASAAPVPTYSAQERSRITDHICSISSAACWCGLKRSFNGELQQGIANTQTSQVLELCPGERVRCPGFVAREVSVLFAACLHVAHASASGSLECFCEPVRSRAGSVPG